MESATDWQLPSLHELEHCSSRGWYFPLHSFLNHPERSCLFMDLSSKCASFAYLSETLVTCYSMSNIFTAVNLGISPFIFKLIHFNANSLSLFFSLSLMCVCVCVCIHMYVNHTCAVAWWGQKRVLNPVLLNLHYKSWFSRSSVWEAHALNCWAICPVP